MVARVHYYIFFVSGGEDADTIEEAACPAPKKKRALDISWHKTNSSREFAEPTPLPPLLETNPELGSLSPEEIFSLFFTDDLLDVIVNQTILYARQKNDHSFHIDKETVKKFIGILITSGFNTRPQEKNYWEKDPIVACPVIADTLPRERFKQIKRYFHFVDNSSIPPNNTDKMFKLRPLLNTLRDKYNQFGQFFQNLCVDEQMIPYFGNHSCKQFIHGKPVRFGYKVWMLCSHNGYCFNFDIYCGKETTKSTGLCKSSQVVIDLLSVVDNPHCHRLYFDNLFNSYELLEELSRKGIQACGTARENRFSLKNASTTPDLHKKPRGSMEEVKSGNISLVRLKDNKVVTFASNYVGAYPADNCTRRIKGQKERATVPRPRSANAYNKNMGGVDLLDKQIGLYRIRLTSKKWYWRIINNFIEVSLHNAWRVHQQVDGELSFLAFLREVATSWMKSQTVNSNRTRPSHKPQESIRRTGRHYISKGSQRRCRVCKKNSKFSCDRCEVPLHIECFAEYHEC